MKGAGYMHRCNIKSKLKIMIEVVNLIFLLGAFLGYISCLSAFSDILIYKKNVVNDVKTISTVEFDMESIKNNKSGENVEIRNPSYDEFVQLANSPDVKSHEINYIDSILSTSLRDIDKDARVGLFNVKGVDKEYFYDLLFENIYLESGRSFSLEELQNADNKLIISNIVAENNNIKVGETLNLEICNPSNAEQHITREFIVIGVFSPKISNNRENENIEINNTIKQFLDHTHSHDEEDEHANEYYRSDQDRMTSLEKFLLIEDVNTIYMPNTTAIKLNAEIGKEYGKDFVSTDYQASYILQSKSKIDNFKSYATKILPDYFTIKCEKDAYELWMPNTTRSEKMLGMYSILLGLIMALYSGFVLIIYISINKSGLIRYRIMGIERRQIYNCLTRRYFLLIMLISVFYIPLGNFIATKYILPSFLYTRIGTDYYYNIQKMTRDIGICFIPKFHYLPNEAFLLVLCITLLIIYFVIRKTVKVCLSHVMGGKINV